MKLARRLSIALFLGVLPVIAGFAYVRFERDAEAFDVDMRRDHRVMGTSLRPALWETRASEGEARMLEVVLRANAEREGVRIRWVWVQSGDPEIPVSELPLDELRAGREVQREVPVRFEAGPHLVSYIPVLNEENGVGALEIAESLAQRSAHLRSTLWTTGLTSFGVALVCGAVALGIGRWFVGRPVTKLIDKARRVGRGDLEDPLVLEQNDELGELAQELNSMCEHLERAQSRVENETRARIDALAQLRHADRLTTIGQLTSVLAHEVGTPLNVVAGHARMISRGRVNGPDLEESANVILDQCERMTRIVRQVLDYARRREPKKATVDLLDVVQSTLDLVRPLANKREVSVELRATTDGTNRVAVDASQLQQALTNLIVNAVHASREGSSIDIGVERVTEHPNGKLPSEAEYLRVFVEDHGVGMTEETRGRLFEPFFTTKDAGEGTGLGLSIARDIVAEHEGFIEVRSTLGSGSRFDVYLPRAEST